MPIDANLLIGLWSADVLYGPGAQEDDLLAFRPDGTGWFAFQRAALQELETFTWVLGANDTLLLQDRLYSDGEKTVPLDPVSCAVLSIASDQPGSREVVTFNTPLPRAAKYGLLGREPEKLDFPSFEDRD